MITAKKALALASAGVLAVPLCLSAADGGDKPVLVYMQAALDIDRGGQVTGVTFVDDKKLPDAIRQRAELVARSWKFQPPTKEGKEVGGRTYAGMRACIVRVGDGMNLAIEYAGNGPGSSFRGPSLRGRGTSTAIPVGKLVNQGIHSLRGTIVYRVAADGKAELESATLDDPKLQEQYGVLWKRDQREFLKGFRYRPELVDGVPTATRMESVSEQLWFAAGSRDAEAEFQKRDEQSGACKALRNDDNGRQIASDSPFKLIGG